VLLKPSEDDPRRRISKLFYEEKNTGRWIDGGFDRVFAAVAERPMSAEIYLVHRRC